MTTRSGPPRDPPKDQEAGRRSSGEHPAVRAYRAKLDSVTQGAAKETSKLDRALKKFLEDLKTLVPTDPPPKA